MQPSSNNIVSQTNNNNNTNGDKQENVSNTSTNNSVIPRDILITIFNFLSSDAQTLARIACVCKSWNSIIKDPSLPFSSVMTEKQIWHKFITSNDQPQTWVPPFTCAKELFAKLISKKPLPCNARGEIHTLSEDGNLFAVANASTPKEIILYNSKKKTTLSIKPEDELLHNKYNCEFLSIHDNLLTVLYVNDNKQLLRSYSVETGEIIYSHRILPFCALHHTNIKAFYPHFADTDGRFFAYTDHDKVYILDLASGLISESVTQGAIISQIKFKNGKLVAALSNGYIHVWDVSSGNLKQASAVKVVNEDELFINYTIGSDGTKQILSKFAYLQIDLHSQANKLAFIDTSKQSKKVEILDLNDGKIIHSFTFNIDSAERIYVSYLRFQADADSTYNLSVPNLMNNKVHSWSSNDRIKTEVKETPPAKTSLVKRISQIFRTKKK